MQVDQAGRLASFAHSAIRQSASHRQVEGGRKAVRSGARGILRTPHYPQAFLLMIPIHSRSRRVLGFIHSSALPDMGAELPIGSWRPGRRIERRTRIERRGGRSGRCPRRPAFTLFCCCAVWADECLSVSRSSSVSASFRVRFWIIVGLWSY